MIWLEVWSFETPALDPSRHTHALQVQYHCRNQCRQQTNSGVRQATMSGVGKELLEGVIEPFQPIGSQQPSLQACSRSCREGLGWQLAVWDMLSGFPAMLETIHTRLESAYWSDLLPYCWQQSRLDEPMHVRAGGPPELTSAVLSPSQCIVSPALRLSSRKPVDRECPARAPGTVLLFVGGSDTAV